MADDADAEMLKKFEDESVKLCHEADQKLEAKAEAEALAGYKKAFEAALNEEAGAATLTVIQYCKKMIRELDAKLKRKSQPTSAGMPKAAAPAETAALSDEEKKKVLEQYTAKAVSLAAEAGPPLPT